MTSVNPPRTLVTQVQVTINVEKTGEQLKIITKEKGYKVKDLMTLTGYSSQAVYKWFNGKSLPSIDTFVVLSKALNMEINELLVIDGEFVFLHATAGSMTALQQGGYNEYRSLEVTAKELVKNKGENGMEHTEQLNRVLDRLREEPHKDFKTLGETARSAYPLLMELAQRGGAEDCKLEDLRIALRCNLRRNIIYDSDEEWEEKCAPLVDAIMEAVRAGRDSQIWLLLLQDSLPRRDACRIIGELEEEQIDRDLFPALETQADFLPTCYLMTWYRAALDRSRQHKAQIYNRLAYYYLWYGEYNCNKEEAKRYFREMEQQGIERQNPYPGTFGQHGHDEMIRWLLEDGACADLEGEQDGCRDSAMFRILIDYAKEQLAQVAAHGMRGDIERDEDEVGTVWLAWLEDPCCRDLRESMRRMYKMLLALPPEDERLMFDDYLRTYGAAIKQLIANAGQQGAQPEKTDREKGIGLLLALLLNYDNWLLRIIDLECGTDCSDERRHACIERWLMAIEPFCRRDCIFGDELLVVNSLQENMISYYEKQGAREDMIRLLEQQVYGADAVAVLSCLGEDIDTSYYGIPYCTHNSMALLKLYEEEGEDAKAEQLKRDIAETEETLPPCEREEESRHSRVALRKKYEALQSGEREWTEPEKETEQKSRAGEKRGDSRGLQIVSGYVIATMQTREEVWTLEHTFRPAPPTLRGDFIRFLYSPADIRDWFGMTKKDREEMMKELIISITTT